MCLLLWDEASFMYEYEVGNVYNVVVTDFIHFYVAHYVLFVISCLSLSACYIYFLDTIILETADRAWHELPKHCVDLALKHFSTYRTKLRYHHYLYNKPNQATSIVTVLASLSIDFPRRLRSAVKFLCYCKIVVQNAPVNASRSRAPIRLLGASGRSQATVEAGYGRRL